MGIIKAVTSAIGGALADQWLEVIEPNNMGEKTVMTNGVLVRRKDKRNQNTKGTPDLITNGSVIMVEENQFMLLVDGGKVIDYSGEPGYYKVDNSSAPSLFNGEFDKALEESFNRIKYGGTSPKRQRVYFINTQEIKNIPFGTVNPINYFDNFYNAELYLRCHGYFSIRIVDPLKFYSEVISRNATNVQINDIHKLYLSEFLTALQTAIGKMSVDNIRISHVTSKSMELAKYMSEVLDEDWTKRRGMLIESVGIASISYDEQSKKLIDMRNQGAMLADPLIREGYIQGSVARGIEAAGSNSSGATHGFMGVGMGMQSGGGFVASASGANQAQMSRQQASQPHSTDSWTCSCGTVSEGKFCSNCGNPRPAGGKWKCSECGAMSGGKFCTNCGAKAPVLKCPECSKPVKEGAKFCGECGAKLV